MKRLMMCAVVALLSLQSAFGQSDALKSMLKKIFDSTTLVVKGDIAPDFKVEMLDGKTVSLSDYRGKVVLINFWATWCGPCRTEMKRFPEDIQKRFAGQDFVLLAISRGETREEVEKFQKETGYTFPLALDPTTSIFPLFAKSSIPRNFLVGRDGVVVEATMGYSEGEFAQLLETIEKLLKEK